MWSLTIPSDAMNRHLVWLLLITSIGRGYVIAGDSDGPALVSKQAAIKTKQILTQGDTAHMMPSRRSSTRQRNQHKVLSNQAIPRPNTRDNRSVVSNDEQLPVDQFRLAQLEARRLIDYENTPPVFATPTRKFFVDVVRQMPGSKLTKIVANDEEGDPLEFGLVPSSTCDASAYFRIDSKTGEVWLSDKKLPHCFEHHLDHQIRDSTSVGVTNSSGNFSQDENDRDRNEDGEKEDEPEDGLTSGILKSANSSVGPDLMATTCKNLYFLEITVTDGHYLSYLETVIHVTNSSALQSITGGSLVQLTQESNRRSSQERLDNIMGLKREKSRLSSQFGTSVPRYVNPSLVKPIEHLSPSGTQEPMSMEQQKVTNQNVNTEASSSVPLIVQPVTILPPQMDNQPQHQSVEASHGASLVPQPVQVSLVIICSVLMVALVLLLFVVPISIRRLRKQLKHVETLHRERISKQNSNSGSSTMFSGSSSASSPISHTVTGAPSLSQFTLGSLATSGADLGPGRSVICRQSSLDSSIGNHLQHHPGHLFHHNQQFQIANGELLNRVNNGSIANPVYLQHSFHHQDHKNMHQKQQIISRQNYSHNDHLMHNNVHQSNQQQSHQDRYLSEITRQQMNPRQPIVAPHNDLKSVSAIANNLYYPLDDDDEMYSTIQTEQQREKISKSDRKPQNDQPEVIEFQRNANSRGSNRSSSSIRALARFLSLPARQPAKPTGPSRNPFDVDAIYGIENDIDSQIETSFPSKTIARSSGVERENQKSSHCWEIERWRLETIKILDHGQFGLVWLCNLNSGSNGPTVVAVKTPKRTSVKKEREDLLAEIEIMKLVCGHPNVVKILHCCTTNGSDDPFSPKCSAQIEKPIYLVMEYMELGKLQSFLQNSRDKRQYATTQRSGIAMDTNNNIMDFETGDASAHNYEEHNDDYDDEKESTYGEHQVTSRDLVNFIYHVAKGMEYISSQCIVHRDLASRNILVSAQRVCKIGDFGMARHMQSFSSVYERRSKNAKIPVRWMAPEVLLNNSFTTNSDVFSFGILMWEIITLGSTPYRHLRTEEVIEAVARQGERPTKPEYCHAELYRIMSRCWLTEPKERPTFKALVKQLDRLIVSANNYIELDQYPDHDYYNVPETFAPLELL